MVKKLALNTLGVVLIVAIILWLLQIIIAPIILNSNDYLAASIDKENVLRNTNSPRIIFIGGSNLAFGLDCEQISDTFKLPVINMGLHAGLGVSFMLNEAMQNIKKNDIIILSTEYYIALKGDSKLLAKISELNPTSSNFIENYREWPLIYVYKTQNCFSGLYKKFIANYFDEKIYLRNGFSSNGDLLTYLTLPQHQTITDKLVLTETNYDKEIKVINEFIYYSNKAGAKVYYSFPAYLNSEYLTNKRAINSFELQFKKQLKCSTINKPINMVFNDTCFFNTIYHLNKSGRSLRTAEMIKNIKSKVAF